MSDAQDSGKGKFGTLIPRPGGILSRDISPDLFPFEAFTFDPESTASPVLTLNAPWKLVANIVTLPSGVIQMYGAAAAPTGWLLCDGTSYLRTDYADLFAVIGTTFGSADGTHFNVPNFQGVSPTGVGSQNINARAKAGPALGAVREDQGQGHLHGEVRNLGGGAAVGMQGFTTATAANIAATVDTTQGPSTDGANGVPRVGAYTHGPELGVNFIIKT